MGNSSSTTTVMEEDLLMEKDLLTLKKDMLAIRNNLSCEWNKNDPETNPYYLPKEEYIDEYMPNFEYTPPNVWGAENLELERRMIKHSIRRARYKKAQRAGLLGLEGTEAVFVLNYEEQQKMNRAIRDGLFIEKAKEIPTWMIDHYYHGRLEKRSYKAVLHEQIMHLEVIKGKFDAPIMTEKEFLKAGARWEDWDYTSPEEELKERIANNRSAYTNLLARMRTEAEKVPEAERERRRQAERRMVGLNLAQSILPSGAGLDEHPIYRDGDPKVLTVFQEQRSLI